MKMFKSIFPKALAVVLVFTVICGVLYTGVITVAAQLIFPGQANGSIIEVDGKTYGSSLLGQQYTDDSHLWGRIMIVNTTTFTDASGNPVMYAVPSNESPVSDDYKALVAARVEKIRASHPEMGTTPIPVDLVTVSGSGLDPHISPAAAEYQVERLVKNTGRSQEEVRSIIEKCTEGKFLGVFGEDTVNVLRVNLMLDGIL